jgi:hypothetical protein
MHVFAQGVSVVKWLGLLNLNHLPLTTVVYPTWDYGFFYVRILIDSWWFFSEYMHLKCSSTIQAGIVSYAL